VSPESFKAAAALSAAASSSKIARTSVLSAIALTFRQGGDSRSRAASRPSTTLTPDHVAQTLRPPIDALMGTVSLPESGGITRASPSAG
jgi:hypothetical protein